MNHRERVLTSLDHREPDRIPIDFGGTTDSTIMAVIYQKLRKEMGLEPTKTRVQEIFNHTALIDEDVRQAFGADVLPVLDWPNEWRDGLLPNGETAEFPEKFQPVLLEDGSQVVYDSNGTVTIKMPADAYYFDPVHSPLKELTSVKELEKFTEYIDNYDVPTHLDKGYQEIEKVAKDLHDNTDYLLVGYFGGHIFQSSQSVRGWEVFLMDLMLNKKFAEALMEMFAESHIRRFDRWIKTVGKFRKFGNQGVAGLAHGLLS